MRRPASIYGSSLSSLGPGPVSTALKALIAANVVMFVLQSVFSPIPNVLFGLHPAWVIPAPSGPAREHSFWLWQTATYMFLHAGIFHILFNMLALWMFGAELERMWGTRYFLKFYFVTGIGAGALTVLFSLFPFTGLQSANIIGASGAIYGLLLAYAMYFPDRPILLIVFWVPAKWCVAILGGIALFSSLSDAGGTANATHLGGLLIGYLMLRGPRMHPWSEVKYRYLKWKINRVRKKFDVYSGGRANDYDRRVH
jgi:membrane associated rhomboid family serine protease